MIDTRDRITEGINRQRLKLEARRAVRPSVVVLIGLGIGLLFAGYIVTNVSRTLFTKTYVVKFEVADATAVRSGLNQVRFKGIPAGTIEKVEIDGDRPVLTAKIQKKYGRLFRDARAQLRPNTALQDMYLDVVDRGSEQAGRLGDGDMLPRAQTRMPVNVSDVLNVFQPSQRLRMRTLLDELGNGMADRGKNLRALFVQTTPLLEVAGKISSQLAAREPLVRRLVRDTSVLTGELGRRDDAIRTLVREGSATLSTLQDGSRDLDATLAALAPTIRSLDAGFASIRGVLPDVDRAIVALRPVAKVLPAALGGARGLSADAAPAVAALREPVGALVPFARTLEPLSRDLAASVGRLQPQIDSIDRMTRIGVACKKGFQDFFQWNASISKFGDTRGPVPRGNVVFGAQSSGVFNDPQEYAPEACSGGPVPGGRPIIEQDKR